MTTNQSNGKLGGMLRGGGSSRYLYTHTNKYLLNDCFRNEYEKKWTAHRPF